MCSAADWSEKKNNYLTHRFYFRIVRFGEIYQFLKNQCVSLEFNRADIKAFSTQHNGYFVYIYIFSSSTCACFQHNVVPSMTNLYTICKRRKKMKYTHTHKEKNIEGHQKTIQWLVVYDIYDVVQQLIQLHSTTYYQLLYVCICIQKLLYVATKTYRCDKD